MLWGAQWFVALSTRCKVTKTRRALRRLDLLDWATLFPHIQVEPGCRRQVKLSRLGHRQFGRLWVGRLVGVLGAVRRIILRNGAVGRKPRESLAFESFWSMLSILLIKSLAKIL